METPLNMGPQHPSMHGVLHLNLVIDGEIVKSIDPEVGLIHRGLEKLAENRMYFKYTPIANKIDYIAAAAWENCYISCVEKLMGMEIPERVKYARTIILEVQRIISHMFWFGTLGMDLGQPTIFVWGLREREKLLDIFEDIMGGRMTFGWMIIGGLRDDITKAQCDMILKAMTDLERLLPEYYRMMEENHIFRERTIGVGVLTRQDAVDYGITGPIARASGVVYDVRKDDPYLVYDKMEFNIITRTAGDCYARYEVRRDEIVESIKIVRQAIEKMPEGPYRAANAMTLRPPIALSMRTPSNGEAFVRNECPRGEGMIYIRSDGSNFPYRLRIRGPSFNNMSVVAKMCLGQNIPDLVAIIATIDPVFGECDPMNLIFLDSFMEASRGVTLSILASIGIPPVAAEVLFLALLASTVFNIFAGYAMFGGLLERKLIARIHSRVGPIYTGPHGLLQTAADALKFLRKEIIFPQGSDRQLFVLAPIIMFLTAFMATLFIPIGSFMIIESEYSLLIILALLSFSPISILAGSWASNSKYSTLGGLRAAGMTMAYEVLLIVSVASLILTTHSFSILQIVQYQHAHGVWFALMQPVAFILFLIGATASVERNPFDLTEAESELVSGWKTEYGGVYFSFTLLAEYVKLLVTIILITCLFLGGWMGFGGEIAFFVKIVLLTMLMMYIRATAMRLRMDQLLRSLWTRLIPLAFVNFIVTIGIMQLLGGG